MSRLRFPTTLLTFAALFAIAPPTPALLGQATATKADQDVARA